MHVRRLRTTPSMDLLRRHSKETQSLEETVQCMRSRRSDTLRSAADRPVSPFRLDEEIDEERRTRAFVSNNPDSSMAKPFKVIIVGGSVSGLTLAHCLDRLGVDFEVLERHEHIAPQLGASLGILPNGARILDQLGLFDDVEEHTEPLAFAQIRYADGFRFESQYPKVLHEK